MYSFVFHDVQNSICAAHICMDMGPSIGKMAILSRTTSIRETDSPFPSRYQLSTAPQLGMEAYMSHSSHTGILTGLTLCGPYAGKPSCDDIIVQSPCQVHNTLFHFGPVWPLILKVFLLPLLGCSEPW